MKTKGSIFTKVGRIFVASTLLFTFAGTAIGCGKTNEEKNENAETALAETRAAGDNINQYVRELTAEGLTFFDQSQAVSEIEAETSVDRLNNWARKLSAIVINADRYIGGIQRDDIIGGDEATATRLRDRAQFYLNKVKEKLN